MNIKKIQQQIIGIPKLKEFDSRRLSHKKYNWYGNLNHPCNIDNLPDEFQENIFKYEDKEIEEITYKDTSDKNYDEKGEIYSLKYFIERPKRKKKYVFDKMFKQIKTELYQNNRLDSCWGFCFDKSGNLTLRTYERLGYIQHKDLFEYDSNDNLLRTYFLKDITDGEEKFMKERESLFTYSPNGNQIRSYNYKYENNKKILRGENEYNFSKGENGITKVQIIQIHEKTGNKNKIEKQFDVNSNLIMDYVIQGDKYHPNSFKYEIKYDYNNNWIEKKRKTVDGIVTMICKRELKYKESCS